MMLAVCKQQQLEEAIRRGHLYFAAGADCIYPMALSDRTRISEPVGALPGPVNILARGEGYRSISSPRSASIESSRFTMRCSHYEEET